MSSASLLSVQIKHRAGTLSLDLAFELTQPWTVLFGPSGSGKTTILRTIAGFVQPDSGHITCGAQVVMDHAANLFIPPHQRPVRTANQNARLFPHLTVQQNLLFGAGWPSKPQDQLQTANEIMSLFRIPDLYDRMPRELSGGEQQRVSVARALLSAITFDGPGKAILLLDEPFSGLEASLRDELLVKLKAWVIHWKIPVLSVTHDVAEAFQLGAEVIKIAEGRVLQQGPAEVVLAEERLRLLAQLNP